MTAAETGSIAIAIMAKAPRPGEVKTRLCPPLSPDRAADLYRCFLLDKIAQVRRLSGVRPFIAFTPDDGEKDFEKLAPDFGLVAQRGPDLGSRLVNTLERLLHEGHPGALAIDSDTPTLPTEFLQQAVDWIAKPDVDVVVGPSEDGGYYLIGVRRAHRELFEDMPWSTARVFAETLERGEAARLRIHCLLPWSDVDTPADLERLKASLASPGNHAVHTRRFLSQAKVI